MLISFMVANKFWSRFLCKIVRLLNEHKSLINLFENVFLERYRGTCHTSFSFYVLSIRVLFLDCFCFSMNLIAFFLIKISRLWPKKTDFLSLWCRRWASSSDNNKASQTTTNELKKKIEYIKMFGAVWNTVLLVFLISFRSLGVKEI